METPPSVPEEFAPDDAAARRRDRRARWPTGREWLTEPEAKAVLAAYGIPVAPTRRGRTPRRRRPRPRRSASRWR